MLQKDTIVDKATSILKPFDDESQILLNEVDYACSVQMESLRKEAQAKSLANETLEIDVEVMAWLKIIKAYGILYNRAVDAGWIEGVITESK